MKAKSTFRGPNALSSPTLVPGSPPDHGSNLPMAALVGNTSLGKPVIRWMWVKAGSAPRGWAYRQQMHEADGKLKTTELQFLAGLADAGRRKTKQEEEQ